jgi:hypothetical protein
MQLTPVAHLGGSPFFSHIAALENRPCKPFGFLVKMR